MKERDHEVSMAKAQVKKSIDNLQKVARVLAKKTDADNLPAWVQAKLTDTEHNTDAAADYMGESKKECGKGQYWCKTDERCKKIPAGMHVMPNGDLMSDSEHGDVSEANKSGDSSLRDWFTKSRSSDGKPGWVQLGGKYAGKPCAKQPGQKTKPKCGSSKMAANLDKEEEDAAFNRKQRQDKNPDRKGKAINVKTEERKPEVETQGKKVAGYEKAGKYQGITSKFRKEYPGSRQPKKKRGTKPSEGERAAAQRSTMSRLQAKYGRTTKQKREAEIMAKHASRFDHFEPHGNQINELAPLAGLAIRAGLAAGTALAGKAVYDRAKGVADKIKDQNQQKSDAIKNILRNSYDASGNIIGGVEVVAEAGKKCWKGYKKVGTQKLFGKTYNRCEKENYNYSNWRDEFEPTLIQSIDLIKAEPLVSEKKDACYHKVKSRYSIWPSAYASGALVKCRKVGAKNWGNKTKKEEYVAEVAPKGDKYERMIKHIKKNYAKDGKLTDRERSIAYATAWKQKGREEQIVPKNMPPIRHITGRKIMSSPLDLRTPAEKMQSVKDQVKRRFGEDVQEASAAWTRKAGKNPSGGLNEKGRKSYERENPGSDLKRPSKEVGNKRRASFCARMKGMRKRQKPENNTGQDRLSKSLKAWNC
jgi:hypothetical protein